MRLNLKSFVLAWTILWAGCVLVTGLANMVWNDYGQAFLELCSSVYPGYHRDPYNRKRGRRNPLCDRGRHHSRCGLCLVV